MAHPFAEYRQSKVEKSRVGAITGLRRGGAVKHSDEPEDKALVKNMVRPEALRADGGAVKQRLDRAPRKKGGRVKRADGGQTSGDLTQSQKDAMNRMGGMSSAQDPNAGTSASANDMMNAMGQKRRDGGAVLRRARGGAVKGKGPTTVNVIVAPQGQQQKEPVPVPVPGGVAGGPPPVPPPRPAMPPPMPPGVGPGGPGMPPGGPPMMRARGGAVKSIGMDVGTQVSHSPGKNEKPDQFHTKPPLLTRAEGGRIYASETSDHGPNFDAGGGGGFGRLRKAARARSHYHGPVKEA